MPGMDVSLAPPNPISAPLAAPAAPVAPAAGQPAPTAQPGAPAAPAGDIWADPGLAKFAKDGTVDHAAVAKSYLELQRQLGQQSQQPPAQQPPAAQIPAGTQPTLTQERYTALATELMTAGKFSDASKEELRKAGVPDDWIAWNERSVQNATELYRLQIQAEAGSAEQLAKMRYWASTRIPKADMEAFEAALGSGDIETARPYLAGLRARYEQSIAEPGHQVEGRGTGAAAQPFRSQAELFAAMGDKRYGMPGNENHVDPSYREEVARRVQASLAMGIQLA